jgi:hypothetical protein
VVALALALEAAVEEEGAAGTNGIEVRITIAPIDFGPRMKLLGFNPATMPPGHNSNTRSVFL